MALDLPEVVQRITVKSDADRKISAIQDSLRSASSSFRDTEGRTDSYTRSTDKAGDSSERTGGKIRGLGKETDTTGKTAERAGRQVEATSRSVRGLGDETERTTKHVRDSRAGLDEIHDRLTKVASGAGGAGRGIDDLNRSMDDFGGSSRRANRDGRPLVSTFDQLLDRVQLSHSALVGLGAVTGYLKFPVIVGAVRPLIQGISALGAGVVSLTSSLARTVSVGAALPTVFAGFGLALGAVVVGTRGLSAAFKDMGKNNDKFAKDLLNLSPAAAAFALRVGGMKTALDGVRRIVQQDLFSRLNGAFDRMVLVLPTIQDGLRAAAVAVGNLGNTFARSLTTPQAISDLRTIESSGVRAFTGIGKGAIEAFGALRNVVTVAAPLAVWFGQLATKAGIYVKVQSDMARDSGRLATFFDKAKASATVFGTILGSLGSLIHSVFSVGTGVGDSLFAGAAKSLSSLADAAKSFQGQSAIARWFDAARAPLSAVWGLAKDLFGLFASFGKGSDQGFTALINQLRSQFVPVLHTILTSVSSQLLPAVLTLGATLAKTFAALAGTSGPMFVFLKTATVLATILNTLITTVPGMRELVFVFGALGAATKAVNLAGWATGLSSIARAVSSTDPGKVGVFGRIAQSVVRIGPAAAGAEEGMSGLAGGMLAINPVAVGLGVAALGVVGGFLAWKNAQDAVAARVKEFKTALQASNDTLAQSVTHVSDAAFASGNMQKALASVGETSRTIRPAITGTASDWQTFSDASKESESSLREELSTLQQSGQGFTAHAQALAVQASAYKETREKAFDYREALSEAARDTINHVDAIDQANASLLIQAVRLSQGAKAAEDLQKALQDGSVGAKELRGSQIDLAATAESAVRVERNQVETTQALDDAQKGLFERTNALMGVTAGVGSTYADATDRLLANARATGTLTDAQIRSFEAQATGRDGIVDYAKETQLAVGAIQAQIDAERARRSAIEASTAAVENYNNALLSQYNADLATLRGRDAVTKATATYNAAIKDAKGNQDAVNLATAEYRDVALQQVQNLIAGAEQQRKLGKETRDSAQIQRDALLAVAGTVQDPLRKELVGLAAQVRGLPNADITVAATGVQVTDRELQSVQQSVKDIPGSKIILTATPNADGTITHLVGIKNAQGQIERYVTVITDAQGNAINVLDQTKAAADRIDGRTVNLTVAIHASGSIQGAVGMRVARSGAILMGKQSIGGKKVPAFAQGGITAGPTFLVGEGNPTRPEFVIPSEPQFRQSALKLWVQAGNAIGALHSQASALLRPPSALRANARQPAPVGSTRQVNIGTIVNNEAVDTDLMIARLGATLTSGV